MIAENESFVKETHVSSSKPKGSTYEIENRDCETYSEANNTEIVKTEATVFFDGIGSPNDTVLNGECNKEEMSELSNELHERPEDMINANIIVSDDSKISGNYEERCSRRKSKSRGLMNLKMIISDMRRKPPSLGNKYKKTTNYSETNIENVAAVTAICSEPTASDKNVYCKKCEHTFKLRKNYDAHIKGNRCRRDCPFCGKIFLYGKRGNTSHYNRHLKIHSDVKDWQCKTCGKYFTDRCYLQKHQVTHTGAKPFICNICGVSYSFQSGLREHIKALHNEDRFSHYCQICPEKVFASRSHLRDHSRRCHEGKSKSRRSKGCSSVIKKREPRNSETLTDLSKETKTEATAEAFIETATVSTSAYANATDQLILPNQSLGAKAEDESNQDAATSNLFIFGNHENANNDTKHSYSDETDEHEIISVNTLAFCNYQDDTEHGDVQSSFAEPDANEKVPKNPYTFCQNCKRTFKSRIVYENHLIKQACRQECHFCGKAFFNNYKFTRHVNSHNNIKEWQCKTCGKCFSEKSYLKKHQNTHTGARPYICEKCGDSFPFPSGLLSHKYSVHSEVSHPCSVCHKEYTSRAYLLVHIRLVHDKNHGKSFPCATCGKSFKSFKLVRRHEFTHKEKDFKCDQCPAAFKESGQLREHRRRHSKDYHYFCSTCGKGFYTKQFLRDHVRTHTGEKPHQCSLCDFRCAFRGNLRKHMQKHLNEWTSETPHRCSLSI